VVGAAGAGQLLAQMTRAGRGVIIPLYAADVLGLDARQIGMIVSLSWAADTAMFLPAGAIMDRWGRKAAIVPCFAIQGLGLALISLTRSPAALAAATILIGLGNGLGAGSMMTLGADLSPRTGRSEFLGVWRLIGDVGGTGGPLVVGTVAQALALPLASLAMGCSGLAAALVFALLVPETLRRANG
jgi:MFS family permease